MGNTVRPHQKRKEKIRQEWWHEPAVPATQEAEAGGSLEPEKLRLQSAVIVPLHSSLGNRVRLHVSKSINTYIAHD